MDLKKINDSGRRHVKFFSLVMCEKYGGLRN